MKRRSFFKIVAALPALALVRPEEHLRAEDYTSINFGYGHTITADRLIYTDSKNTIDLSFLHDGNRASGGIEYKA